MEILIYVYALEELQNFLNAPCILKFQHPFDAVGQVTINKKLKVAAVIQLAHYTITNYRWP